jgi:phage protein U
MANNQAAQALIDAANDIQGVYEATSVLRYPSVARNKAAAKAIESTIRFIRDRAERLAGGSTDTKND